MVCAANFLTSYSIDLKLEQNYCIKKDKIRSIKYHQAITQYNRTLINHEIMDFYLSSVMSN
jgi:hypothetical protein